MLTHSGLDKCAREIENSLKVPFEVILEFLKSTNGRAHVGVFDAAIIWVKSFEVDVWAALPVTEE
jgi:hypothetical protein